MQSLNEQQFLDWANSHSMGIDPQYPQAAALRFQPDVGEERFWCTPQDQEYRPYFIQSILNLLGKWNSCHVWRAMGSWPDFADPNRPDDVEELRLLKGLGLPVGTADIVEFSREDYYALFTLVFSTTIFGWSVGEDIYIVPDHAEHIVEVSHHDVIWVSCRNAVEMDRLITEMRDLGFPLPDDIPDQTFKRPAWMNKK